jgi:hypothetical protein
MLASAWLLLQVVGSIICSSSVPIADPRIRKEGSHRLEEVLKYFVFEMLFK